MNIPYEFEPKNLEIIFIECVGNTLIRGYYSELVASLKIKGSNKILDYCCGSGIISRKISRKIKDGELIYTDMSKRWLKHTSSKLKSCKYAKGVFLDNFTGIISGGEYNKILIHYVLHDFPKGYRIQIINQAVKNLRTDGILFIREPMEDSHGIKLHELFNLIESVKKLSYEYEIITKPLIGKYVHIKCRFKK